MSYKFIGITRHSPQQDYQQRVYIKKEEKVQDQSVGTLQLQPGYEKGTKEMKGKKNG